MPYKATLTQIMPSFARSSEVGLALARPMLTYAIHWKEDEKKSRIKRQEKKREKKI